MKLTELVKIFSFFLIAGPIASCNETAKNPSMVVTNEPTNLNAIQTELPSAPGYETFKTNCLSCHSARYIQMQPDFPEKTWATIVGKMQKNFGAPIADSSVKEIVQYLVAIKGGK
ncbi:MAG: cytochrome c [Panacibacter sp.]